MARRDEPAEVATEQENDRLVQGDPEAHARAQRVGHDRGVAPKGRDAVRVLPAAPGPEPAGVRVVVEGHDGLDPEPPERVHALPLQAQRVVREEARLGLDGAALDREPVGVGPERRAGARDPRATAPGAPPPPRSARPRSFSLAWLSHSVQSFSAAPSTW